MSHSGLPDPIPVVRLDNEATWEAIQPRLRDLVAEGRFILGPEVVEFEAAAARTFGCAWAVGTSSGTSALYLALRAAPLPPGARLAIQTNSFYAAMEAVVAAGFVPVLVDHDEDYGLSVEAIRDLDIDGVVATHLYGLPMDMDALMEVADRRGWWVLEDCSQAHGATVGGRPVGSIGHAGAFSAYPTKNLGAWGDAGFVTGSDRKIERVIRSLRHHAQPEANVHVAVGGADRLDNLQALVLTEKLLRLPEEVEARRRVAGWYRAQLSRLGLELPGDRGDRIHVYHQFVVRVRDRDRVRERLAARGVGTGIHYPTPIHLQPGAQGHCEVPATPKRAEDWAGQLLSLPMYPSLREEEVARVADALAAEIG